MLHTLPDWAIRHNYFHHSNPHNKDRAKDFFEKSHVRPLVDKAFAVLKNSTSEKKKIEARGVLSRLYEGRSSADLEAGRGPVERQHGSWQSCSDRHRHGPCA